MNVSSSTDKPSVVDKSLSLLQWLAIIGGLALVAAIVLGQYF